jgi:hypothetical protein
MKSSIRFFLTPIIFWLAAGGQVTPAQTVPTVSFCDVAAHPESYVNKRVRLRAIYRVGFEWQEIYSLRCVDAPSTWVEFSENFEETSSRKAMKQMEVGKHFSISVGVVLEGRLSGYGGGYGHMNGYSLAFDVERVESAKRLDNHGFHRRALLPDDRKRIERYENIAATEQALGADSPVSSHY